MKKQFSFVKIVALGVMMQLLAGMVWAGEYVPLANSVRKLKSGALRVAVVGDSIGWGQGVAAAKIQGIDYGNRVTFNSKGMPKGNPMGYARVTTDYIKYLAKRDFGVADAKIETFYSVWGGATTKSAYGYFSDDIVSRRPDLLIYEVWNDCPESLRFAENTLRTLWRQCPEADVLLVSVGGAFARGAIKDPLVAKYAVPWIDAYGPLESWFGRFGKVHSNDYGVVDANGKVAGMRGFIFGNSAPHVTEEGYTWFSDNIVAALEKYFAAAKKAKGPCVAVAPTGSLESDLISAKGDGCLYSEVISPRSLVAEGAVEEPKWSVSVAEIANEPRDTMDRATSDRLAAKLADATIVKKVTGRVLVFRDCRKMAISVNDGPFAEVKPNSEIKLTDGEGDASVTITLKALEANGYFKEFYVYGSVRREIPAVPSKHRYSVKFFAKVDTLHYHDWNIGKEQVLPHPLTWLNCFREETYGAPVKAPGASVIGLECVRNGKFLGWIEPDEEIWNKSERMMSVKSFANRKIYAPGEEIDVAKLGRDLTLVAAFSDGPLSVNNERTYKVVFASENTIKLKTLGFVEVSPKNPKVTMPAMLPPRAGCEALGWSIVNDTKVHAPGESVTISSDAEFIPVYRQTAKIDASLLKNCWTLEGGVLKDGNGWELKAKVVGSTLEVLGVKARPDSLNAPDFSKLAVNSAHDTLYLGYAIAGNAFKNIPITGVLKLDYVTSIGAGAFYGSKLESVFFGAYLEEIGGNWCNGAFQNCQLLRSVKFDARGNAVVSSGEGFTFQGCAMLESVDLSGVAELRCGNAMRSLFGGCKGIATMIVREGSVKNQDVFANSNVSMQKGITFVKSGEMKK